MVGRKLGLPGNPGTGVMGKAYNRGGWEILQLGWWGEPHNRSGELDMTTGWEREWD